MKNLFNWAHWADFADGYDTPYETHFVMCCKCGNMAIETHVDGDKYTAYIGDTLVVDEEPIDKLELGVCRLPRRCKCGAHMLRRNREYEMFLPATDNDNPYPIFVLVQDKH